MVYWIENKNFELLKIFIFFLGFTSYFRGLGQKIMVFYLNNSTFWFLKSGIQISNFWKISFFFRFYILFRGLGVKKSVHFTLIIHNFHNFTILYSPRSFFNVFKCFPIFPSDNQSITNYEITVDSTTGILYTIYKYFFLLILIPVLVETLSHYSCPRNLTNCLLHKHMLMQPYTACLTKQFPICFCLFFGL